MQSYRSRDRRKNKPVHFVHPEHCTVVAGADESYDSEPVFAIHSNEHVPPIIKSLKINGKSIEFELDTGSYVSIISTGTAETLFDCSVKYRVTDQKLHTFVGHSLQVLGKVTLTAQYGRKCRKLPLYIVNGSGPNLLRRYWLKLLDIHIPRINAIHETTLSLEHVLQKHAAVFQPGLGELKGTKVHLPVKPDISPTFYKPRPVPYAWREKVNNEIDRFIALGVFKPISHAKWAAPLVLILIADKKSIRLCSDYRVTINKAVNADQFPLPKTEDIFSKLAEKNFAKLDLLEAYTQLVLDEERQKLAALNTEKGIMAVTRLAYGISARPAIFQRKMEELLQSVPQASVYIDDVIVAEQTKEKLIQVLDALLSIFEEAGIRLNKKKCQFLLASVTYLCHVVDQFGIHPTVDKMEAIRDAPTPTDVSTLRSFIGLISFYSKFINNQGTIIAPLYALLQNKSEWQWSAEHDKAFAEAKHALLDSQVLVHCDPTYPVVVSCDASPFGIGAVLDNVVNGEERPVLFISRSLTQAEKSYSQLERESLNLIFAVVRFRQYLLGREFTIVTDHRPLLSLFNPSKAMPPVAAARVMRWSFILSGYRYQIRYRKAEDHGNVDALSKLPLPSTDSNDQECPTEVVLFTDQWPQSPCTAKDNKRNVEILC